MMRYPLEVKVQVVVLMAKFESPVMVIRELQRQGITDIPTRQTISSIYQKFLDTGSVQNVNPPGRPSTITEDKIDEVEQALTMQPMNSVRNIARVTDISKSQAHRIMRNIIGLKPYMMHCTQQLYDEDMDLRVEMAERLIPILEDQANDDIIFFSDESCFPVSGLVNKHNCRIWSTNNPNITLETAMNSAKVNVWCAMSRTQIIGPYFFEDETIN